MTSNLGSEHLTEAIVSERHRQLVMDAVQRFFRPEFLNRLDDIVIFSALSPDDLRQILDLMLNKEVGLLAARGIKLEVNEAARTWMLAQNEHPEWGARPLRRIIRRHLREPLADYLLERGLEAGSRVRVGTDDVGLAFDMERG